MLVYHPSKHHGPTLPFCQSSKPMIQNTVFVNIVSLLFF